MPIALRQVDVVVDSLVADIDANQDEMGGEQRRVFRLVQILRRAPCNRRTSWHQNRPAHACESPPPASRADSMSDRALEGSGKTGCGERRSASAAQPSSKPANTAAGVAIGHREQFLHVCSSLRFLTVLRCPGQRLGQRFSLGTAQPVVPEGSADRYQLVIEVVRRVVQRTGAGSVAGVAVRAAAVADQQVGRRAAPAA